MCKSCVLPSRLRLPSDIPVQHVTTADELSALVSDLLANHAVLALDAEWRPGNAVPALLQVACDERVALVDLAALRGSASAPAALRDLLTNPAVLRLGWRFASDLRVLEAAMPCLNLVEGYVELADVPVPEAESAGLSGYAQALLGLDLCKAEQCSDWEMRPLSEAQVEYAALDAYSLLLMAEQAGADLPVPVVLTPATGTANNGGTGGGGGGGGGGGSKEQFMPRPSKSLRNNPEKRNAFITRFCVKNQAYSNCRILSASGVLIAHCDRSKALWYLSRGLATHISGSTRRGPVPASEPDCMDEEPLTVQLNFCPEERRDGTDFERIASPVPRRNRCVVCGTEETLSRYHLVPRSYQRFFKVEYKAKQSTDIVLLCVDCHEVANRHVMALKLRIAKEYKAPLKGEGLVVPTRAERAVVKCAAALLRGVDNIPPTRVAELKATVHEWWATQTLPPYLVMADALSPPALKYAALLGREPTQKGGWQAAMAAAGAFRPHGQIVVDSLHADQTDDELHAFIVRWRSHFVSALAPKFMPHDWRMTYRRTPSRATGASATGDGAQLERLMDSRVPVRL